MKEQETAKNEVYLYNLSGEVHTVMMVFPSLSSFLCPHNSLLLYPNPHREQFTATVLSSHEVLACTWVVDEYCQNEFTLGLTMVLSVMIHWTLTPSWIFIINNPASGI